MNKKSLRPIYDHNTPIDNIESFLFGEELIKDIDRQDYQDKYGYLHFFRIHSPKDKEVCGPHGEKCVSTNGYQERVCQIMPIGGRTAYVHIRQERFVYIDENGKKATFVRPVKGYRFNQRRSDELSVFLLAVSIFCSASITAQICQSIGIDISHDTITRIYQNITIEDNLDIEAIGIDDVSVRKGRTYHTVIYDMKTHQVIALLDGRDGQTLKDWLRNHQAVKIVARDRATAFASAVSEILPDCIQVADRFHLFQNLVGRMKDFLKVEIPSTLYVKDGELTSVKPETEKTAPELLEGTEYDNTPAVDENGQVIAVIAKKSPPYAKQYERQAQSRLKKYEKIKAMRNEWMQTKKPKYKDFQEKYEVSYPFLRKYLAMTDEEVEAVKELRKQKKRRTLMDDYGNMIYKMIADGHKPSVIYSYVKSKGCSAGYDIVLEYIRQITEAHFKKESAKPDSSDYGESPQIKRYDIIKYMIINDRDKMKDTEVAKYYEQILEKYEAAQFCDQLYKDFHEVLMGDDPHRLDWFLLEYEGTKIQSFLNGLKRDIAPVKNAISHEHSSGFVEGGNCRYKLVKRTMFGKANIEHLFHKFYAQSSITCCGLNARGLLTKWIEQSRWEDNTGI